MKKAFTLIDLIFIIVIIGILSAVAVPRLAATRDDALIAKNSEYIIAIMNEISSYIIANGDSKDNLTEMSSILERLHLQNRVLVNIVNKSATVQIGEDQSCITVDLNTSTTTETLSTSFPSSTSDRICKMVQSFIKEKDYPLIVRGKLIRY